MKSDVMIYYNKKTFFFTTKTMSGFRCELFVQYVENTCTLKCSIYLFCITYHIPQRNSIHEEISGIANKYFSMTLQ